MTTNYISAFHIHQNAPESLAPHLKSEQGRAAKEIANHAGLFKLCGNDNGPYDVTLSIEDERLILRIKDNNAHDLPLFGLALKPYKRTIQDYFLMIESYEDARREGRREKLEAIDMGRRGLHNEGADLFQSRLKDKIEMDHETARKFFTLICTLHKSHMNMLR